MPDLNHFKKFIIERLAELDVRLHEVDHELGEPRSAALNEQAIDIEDDEVLEGLGAAAQKEVSLLRLALKRIEEGSYGICAKCEEPISDARLEAVPYAPLCKRCAQAA
jgi:RNA polymerase-binding transcription factor DksA